MRRAHVVFSLVFALVSAACADAVATDGGDDGEIIGPVPDRDPQLRCLAAGSLALSQVGPILGGVVLGACGHLAYHDDQGQGYLVEPDGARSELEHASHRVAFVSTGDLLAWERNLDGGLRLRDLLGNSERTIHEGGPVDGFAFVPSFTDPDRSAWLWSCEQGVLERHDVGGSDLVAESVVCGSVVGSSGSPRLGFADDEGRVWLADLDADVLVGSDDLEFVGHDGSKRDDTLWVDHDGELIVHVAIEWQGDDDIDSEWPVELWARVLDRAGATVLDAPSGLAQRQAPRRGAPVFVFQQGQIVRFDAGAPSSVDVTLDSAELAGSGDLFLTTQTDDVLVAESAAGEPLTMISELGETGEFGTLVELEPSPSGDFLTFEQQSDICIVDEQGECARILMALRAWSRESGVTPEALLSSSPWDIVATFDDGSMLVVGAPVYVDGPTYAGEQPAPRILLLDRYGALQAESPGVATEIRQTFRLADGSILFEHQYESGFGSLVHARTGEEFSGLITADIAPQQAWVNERGDRVAFVTEAGSDLLLVYGGL